jgi:hypothetical protein
MSASQPPPGGSNPVSFQRNLIEKEIEHLKKRTSSRHAADNKRAWSKVIVVAVVLGLLWLYAMDPVLFSWNRGDAIRVYLYLHNYGNDQTAQAVANCGLLTPGEVTQLNRRQGAFQDYFAGTAPAEKQAAGLIAYMKQVHALHGGDYDSLSLVNKVRYVLFIKTGLTPPIHWNGLNSSIDK